MAQAQITCIVKSDPVGGHEHITHVGNSSTWMWTVEQVIESIDNKTNTFFVEDPRTGLRAWVGVVRPTGRRAHIRTYADGVWTDNLLSLSANPRVRRIWGIAPPSFIRKHHQVMADNLTNRGPQDRSRINVNQAHEVRYWTQELRCTEAQLRQAVKQVGVLAADVRAHLRTVK